MNTLEQQAENQPINLTLLDTLVVDYLYHEGVLDENINRENAESFSKYQDKMATLKKIRELMLDGRIAESMELVKQIQPSVLSDQKLLFKLHKQQFIEMLRRGEDPKVALQHAQNTLVPMALHAFPDAYSEFKNSLLLLIFKETESSSIKSLSEEWNIAHRDELASSLHATLLASLGVQETIFPLLLRYLSTIHNYYHVMNGLVSPFPEIERLLLPDRLPPPIPKDPDFRVQMSDVHALAQAACIPQETAINAIKNTKGSVEEALKNELARIQLNHDLLTHEVLEYCEYRGIFGKNVRFSSKGSKYQAQYGNNTNNNSAESTVAEKIQRLKKIREALTEDNGGIGETVNEIVSMDPTFSKTNPHTYFQLRQFHFRECLRLGLVQEAISISTNELTPIANEHPDLQGALRNTILLLAFSPNTPLPPGIEIMNQHPSTLAGPLYTMLGNNLKLVEPRILKMIKYLIKVHIESFKQNVAPDRFEKLFKINELKKPEDSGNANPNAGITNANPNAGGNPPGAGIGGGGNPDIEGEAMDESEEGIDENSINTLIELANFTRDQAIAVLQEYGDVNEALQALFP